MGSQPTNDSKDVPAGSSSSGISNHSTGGGNGFGDVNKDEDISSGNHTQLASSSGYIKEESSLGNNINNMHNQSGPISGQGVNASGIKTEAGEEELEVRL